MAFCCAADDRVNLDSILTLFVLTFKDVLEAHERGFVDRETYLAWEGYIGTNLAMPGGKFWWNQGRNLFIDQVQLAVDAAIARTPPYNEIMPSMFTDNS